MGKLQDIKEALVKRKEEMFKSVLKDIESTKAIEPISLDELEKIEREELRLKTGTGLDEMIGGGVPEGKSMMLYGEFGTGKTQTCFTAAVLCPHKVVYIDTEGSFRMSRIKEICKARDLDIEEVKNKIIYFRPKTWAQQMLVLFSIPSPADENGKIDLIICDSFSKHFRSIEFLGRENLGIKNGLIREFILTLEQIADMHRAALIYTTQIYDKVSGVAPMAGPASTQLPVGGRSAEHQPDIVLHFRKGSGNIRVARMVDSSWNKLAERSFVINEKGIDIIPISAKAYSTEENRAKRFERTQEKEEIHSKGRAKNEEENNVEESQDND